MVAELSLFPNNFFVNAWPRVTVTMLDRGERLLSYMSASFSCRIERAKWSTQFSVSIINDCSWSPNMMTCWILSFWYMIWLASFQEYDSYWVIRWLTINSRLYESTIFEYLFPSIFLQPDRSDELARIQALGGRVIFLNGARVEGILAMSRAIGKYSKTYLRLWNPPLIWERKKWSGCNEQIPGSLHHLLLTHQTGPKESPFWF